jgi:hypothetical protein
MCLDKMCNKELLYLGVVSRKNKQQEPPMSSCTGFIRCPDGRYFERVWSLRRCPSVFLVSPLVVFGSHRFRAAGNTLFYYKLICGGGQLAQPRLDCRISAALLGELRLQKFKRVVFTVVACVKLVSNLAACHRKQNIMTLLSSRILQVA